MEMEMWGILIAGAAVLLAPRLGLDWRPALPALWLSVVFLSLSLIMPAVQLEAGYDAGRALMWSVCGSRWLGTLLLFVAFLRFAPRE